MKFKEIKKLLDTKLSSKELKEIISKISPSDLKKELRNKSGSIINIIRKKKKNSIN